MKTSILALLIAALFLAGGCEYHKDGPLPVVTDNKTDIQGETDTNSEAFKNLEAKLNELQDRLNEPAATDQEIADILAQIAALQEAIEALRNQPPPPPDPVTCGEGTMLVEGVCVPEPDDTPPAGDDPVDCGEGTILVEGVCVPEDEDPDSDDVPPPEDDAGDSDNQPTDFYVIAQPAPRTAYFVGQSTSEAPVDSGEDDQSSGGQEADAGMPTLAAVSTEGVCKLQEEDAFDQCDVERMSVTFTVSGTNVGRADVVCSGGGVTSNQLSSLGDIEGLQDFQSLSVSASWRGQKDSNTIRCTVIAYGDEGKQTSLDLSATCKDSNRSGSRCSTSKDWISYDLNGAFLRHWDD